MALAVPENARPKKLQKRVSFEFEAYTMGPFARTRNSSSSPTPFATTIRRRTSSPSTMRENRLRRSSNPLLLRLRGNSLTARATENASRGTSIKRWDGSRRTTTSWDSLKQDRELWFPRGDCLVYFSKRGQSRRGPSLRVFSADIRESSCEPLLELCPLTPAVDRRSSAASESSSSSDGESQNHPATPARYELYIPAPSYLSREDAFRYHTTTRNFFAWMYNVPLVGDRLGEALMALRDRMNVFRSSKTENREDLLAYLDGQAYTDFRECSDHSLAILHYAEQSRTQDLWTDAFVHCVGMSDHLANSAEYESISRTSRALITRARTEMDMRLERAGSSLAAFLEDELSSAYLGLSTQARLHLERFRSFLHSFYVGRYGYWPPPPREESSCALPDATYRSLYSDFRNLYEYLVDRTSSNSIQGNKPADGGICVLQNTRAFDQRNRYSSLPHPLPLLPEIPPDLPCQKVSTVWKLWNKKQAKLDRRLTALAALSAATNPSSAAVVDCCLIREYLRFERTWTMKESNAVNSADARKVRWILVYTILQTLISVTQVPKEVRDTSGVSYPLCCQIVGTPPWPIRTESLCENEESQSTVSQKPEIVIQIEPDIDYTTPKPDLYLVRRRAQRTWSLPRRMSFAGKDTTSLRPALKKSTSCGVLLSQFETSDAAENLSDASSPGSSTSRTDSGDGWSPSASDDGMDHLSVSGSVSVYADGEEERDSGNAQSSWKRASSGSFEPNPCNPEVDRYIYS